MWDVPFAAVQDLKFDERETRFTIAFYNDGLKTADLKLRHGRVGE